VLVGGWRSKVLCTGGLGPLLLLLWCDSSGLVHLLPVCLLLLLLLLHLVVMVMFVCPGVLRGYLLLPLLLLLWFVVTVCPYRSDCAAPLLLPCQMLLLAQHNSELLVLRHQALSLVSMKVLLLLGQQSLTAAPSYALFAAWLLLPAACDALPAAEIPAALLLQELLSARLLPSLLQLLARPKVMLLQL
jgi:hypothetical protein